MKLHENQLNLIRHVELSKKMHVPEVQRILVVWPEDLEVARMYPDVNEAKGVSILAYRSA